MSLLRSTLTVISICLMHFVLGQSGKKIEALKKINSVSDAQQYIKNHGPTSAKIGNFSRKIDSLEYKEIESNYKVGDIFYYKKWTVKILCNAIEPIFRCQYIVLDGNKWTSYQVDSIRNEVLTKYANGMPFKNLAIQYSMETKVNGGDSGWFHQTRMGEAFCKNLSYKKIGEIFLFDDVEKKKYYVVLKTHSEQYADSWVFVAM